ncbi:MAG: GGDEF domain-containing protein [Candidatus Micrarchaeota archaeon]
MEPTTRKIILPGDSRPISGTWGAPLTECLKNGHPGIAFHDGIRLTPTKTSDSPMMDRALRVGRMVTEDFQGIEQYVSKVMGEFQCARLCQIYLAPKNQYPGPSTETLEQRMSVWHAADRWGAQDFGESISSPLDPVFHSFMRKTPTFSDYRLGLRFVYTDLDMDSDRCDIYREMEPRAGSRAIMPFYYRNSEQPSGVVVLEGDLRYRDSTVPGFDHAYWSARLAMVVAQQISFQLIHRYDAVTSLTRVADFRVDFCNSIRRLMGKMGENLFLLLVDLDNFKRVNEAYGYRTGDEVLSRVAERLNSSIRVKEDRPPDTISRLGGEEFGIILRDVTAEKAVAVAERVRQGVEELRVPSLSESRPDEEIRVTCSIGVADVKKVVLESKNDESAEVTTEEIQAIFARAFERSNRHLKGAKENGKNRVFIAT